MKENLKYSDANNMLNVPLADMEPEQAVHAPEAPLKETVSPEKKRNKGLKAAQDFLGGGYLSQKWVTGNLFFILYLGLIAMVYIGNTYYTEKKFKSIERTKNELKELRYQYITTKSVLMFQGRQSEISKRALTHGLKETTMPPYKIFYSAEALMQKR